MIALSILLLILILLFGLSCTVYIKKKAHANDLKVLKNFFSNLDLKLDKTLEYKILLINYDSIDFKKLDEFLCTTEMKCHIFLNSPTWLFNTRKEKWLNHYVVHTKKTDFLYDNNYELILYDSAKGKLIKHSNALAILQCIEALEDKNFNVKGKKAWI
ncbi:hypothetical protein ACFVT8_09280 [Lysinibacillus sp. NPDC058147]|uniref:hypothetical protein n=1 Tax=unclassified Lysinibacillus TaxID=2636778 RepID=UPI0036DC71BF